MRTCVLTIALTALMARAEPPRLVRAAPDHGEVGVDASTAQLRLEFDQDMRPGRSICGGGDSFPEITAPPVWESPRVLVVPVKLLPGREYRFGVNCPAARNFRGVNGEAAVISPVLFRTAEEGVAVGAMPLTPEMNQQALRALRGAIDTGYSYRDRVVKDWDAALAPFAGAMTDAGTRSEFARAAARALEAARDPHASVRVGDAVFPGYTPDPHDPPENYDLRRLSGLVRNLKRPNDVVWTGEVGEKTAYVAILSWPGDRSLVLPARDAILNAGREGKHVLLDVRMNGGGDELTARAIAALFASFPTVYSRNRLRDPDAEGGWTKVLDRVLSPDTQHFAGKVGVLMGRGCMSSNESFLLMMRHAANATLIGERSFGSSGRPMPHDLPNGVSVVLPSWVDLTPDAKEIEGVGIEPDIPAAFDPSSPRDGVLDVGVKGLEADRALDRPSAASITAESLFTIIRELPAKRSASGGEEDTDGLRACEELVLSKLRALGYEPATHEFEWAPPWRTPPGESPDEGEPKKTVPRMWRNIIAEIKGNDLGDQVLVLSAHMDSVTGSPGADDDASGVAGLLEVARVYQERLKKGERPRRTIRLCFFNAEEGGVVGSTRYAASIGLTITHGEHDAKDAPPPPMVAGPRVVGMVSMEMIGFFSDEPGSQKSPFAKVNGHEPPSVGDSIVLMTLAKYRHFCGMLAERMRQAEPGLKVTRVDSLPLPVPDFLRSDHRAFALAGVPGIMMTDTANYRNPNYHKPTDTPETLDAARYPMVVRATASAWWSLAGEESLDPPAK